MPRRPPYSQHFSRALGSPAALVVLSLHVALGPVLQRARHIALHHIGTVAPRGKHSETPSPPAPADSSALAIQPAPRQACLPLTLPVRSLWGGRSWRDTPPPPPQLVQLLGRVASPTPPTGDRDSSGGMQGVGMEQSPPVPSLLLAAQARGRQALLVWPGWVSWLLLLGSPCTPALTCPHPTASKSPHGSQRCPALLAALWVPGCQPSAMRSLFLALGGSGHLLWVKGVQLNPCTLNTALLTLAVLGSLLSLRQCLAHSIPPSRWLPHQPPAVVTWQLSPA